jgi:hypothetical protein
MHASKANTISVPSHDATIHAPDVSTTGHCRTTTPLIFLQKGWTSEREIGNIRGRRGWTHS